MINVVVWLLCGACIGVAGMWRRTPPDVVLLLFIAAGILGALGGGTVIFVFDTTPLNTLSGSGVLGAVVGALILVLVARQLHRAAI
jgi:uncharacterized membrane protein YeaQ/YmgE (transglycosylase-associated protein family)